MLQNSEYVWKNQPEAKRHKWTVYLVHAGIGEKQRGIVQWDGSWRVDVRVLMATEEVNELLADLSCSQRGVHSESALWTNIHKKGFWVTDSDNMNIAIWISRTANRMVTEKNWSELNAAGPGCRAKKEEKQLGPVKKNCYIKNSKLHCFKCWNSFNLEQRPSLLQRQKASRQQSSPTQPLSAQI